MEFNSTDGGSVADFCKKISQKDKPRRSSSEDTSDSGPNEEEEGCGPFIHHPFKLRDNQPNIVMNIAVSFPRLGSVRMLPFVSCKIDVSVR